jgi:predicted dehydrogenase
VSVAGQHFPHYRPAYRDTYYKDRATGGGAIQDALTHIVNAVEWLVGPLHRCIVDAAHCALPSVEVEDTVHVLARHSDILAIYALNQHQSPNEITITVVCEKGTLRCELHKNRIRWMCEPGGEWHDEPGPKHERDDLFISQLQSFLDSIETGSPPLCTLDEGIQTLLSNDAMLRSLEEGKWIEARRSEFFAKPG